MRRKFGDRDVCQRCGQDIEWQGRAAGWRDRGNGQECLPYIKQGEVIRPKGKHTNAVKELYQRDPAFDYPEESGDVAPEFQVGPEFGPLVRDGGGE